MGCKPTNITFGGTTLVVDESQVVLLFYSPFEYSHVTINPKYLTYNSSDFTINCTINPGSYTSEAPACPFWPKKPVVTSPTALEKPRPTSGLALVHGLRAGRTCWHWEDGKYQGLSQRRGEGGTARCQPANHIWLVVTGTMEFDDFPQIGKSNPN